MPTPITSWDFTDADWDNPDPRDSRYWYCLAEALKERVAAVYYYTATLYSTNFLDALPYENANLYAGFPRDDFDSLLRTIVPKFYVNDVVLNDYINSWVKANYDVDDDTSPSIAKTKATPPYTGDVQLLKQDGDWYWVNKTSATSLSIAQWTWETLCIDELEFSREDLITTEVIGVRFDNEEVGVKRWLVTRRKILDKLRKLNWGTETISTSIAKQYTGGNLRLKRHERMWYCFSNAPVDPCASRGDYRGFCAGVGYSSICMDSGDCPPSLVANNTTALVDGTSDPIISMTYFPCIPPGSPILISVYDYYETQDDYGGGCVLDFIQSNVINCSWIENRNCVVNVSGNGKAYHRCFIADYRGDSLDPWSCPNSWDRSNVVPIFTGDCIYDADRTTDELCEFVVNKSEQYCTPNLNTVGVTSQGMCTQATTWYTPTQAELNADPVTYWTSLLFVLGKWVLLSNEDFKFKDW